MLPTKENIESFRKNFLAYAVLGLSGAVVYLFHLYIDLNSEIKNGYREELRVGRQVIIENTRALTQFQNRRARR